MNYTRHLRQPHHQLLNHLIEVLDHAPFQSLSIFLVSLTPSPLKQTRHPSRLVVSFVLLTYAFRCLGCDLIMRLGSER